MLQKRGPGGLPLYANGTTDPIGMVWDQILKQLNQLNAATVSGNDTTEDVARLLAAADVNKMDAKQAQKMLDLLGQMTNEMQRGGQVNIEALDNLEAELSATIGASVFDGIVRFEDGSLGPVTRAIEAQTRSAEQMGVTVLWEQILDGLQELTTVTGAGNATTDEISKMLNAVDLNELGAEEAARIGMLLSGLVAEMEKGGAANADVIKGMKAALTAAIRGAMQPAAGEGVLSLDGAGQG